MYYESNRFPEAIDAYQTALSMAPENEDAKVGLQRAKQR
jgi:cytochrome c-type biogenesis protein CcmH/NrfG